MSNKHAKKHANKDANAIEEQDEHLICKDAIEEQVDAITSTSTVKRYDPKILQSNSKK